MSVQAAMNNLVSSSLGFLNQTFSMLPSSERPDDENPEDVKTEEPEVEEAEVEEDVSVDTTPNPQASQKAAAEQNAYNRVVEKVEGQTNQKAAMEERLDMLKLRQAAMQMREEGAITSNRQLKSILYHIGEEK